MANQSEINELKKFIEEQKTFKNSSDSSIRKKFHGEQTLRLAEERLRRFELVARHENR